jgi:MFS family permease
MPPRAWALLLFLTLLNVLNFVDRQLIATLAPMLIADLGLTRAQIGLLAGFSFVVFYSVAGLALGALADRWSRVRLVSGGLALWSGMTAASGAAQGFAQLAGARVLVGVGEATLTPAALSMLSDACPPSRLGTATSIYYAGIPLGTALSLIIAGWMAPHYGWRACFYVLGAFGLVAAAAMLLVPEPPRRGARPAAGGLSPGAVLSDVAATLRRVPSLALTLLGGVGLAFAAGSALLAVTWLVEERGFEFRTAAYTAGAIAAVAGFVGNVLAGAFSDWCDRRWPGGRLWALVALTATLAPVAALFFTLPPGSPLFYACWLCASAFTTAWFGPFFAVVQQLSPAASHASTVAFTLLVLNILGVGPGPWVAGLIGDRATLTAGLLVGLAVGAVSIVPLSLAARRFPADLARLRAGQA